ncbi:unnamed protein product [Ixodes pacificus]
MVQPGDKCLLPYVELCPRRRGGLGRQRLGRQQRWQQPSSKAGHQRAAPRTPRERPRRAPQLTLSLGARRLLAPTADAAPAQLPSSARRHLRRSPAWNWRAFVLSCPLW